LKWKNLMYPMEGIEHSKIFLGIPWRRYGKYEFSPAIPWRVKILTVSHSGGGKNE